MKKLFQIKAVLVGVMLATGAFAQSFTIPVSVTCAPDAKAVGTVKVACSGLQPGFVLTAAQGITEEKQLLLGVVDIQQNPLMQTGPVYGGMASARYFVNPSDSTVAVQAQDMQDLVLPDTSAVGNNWAFADKANSWHCAPTNLSPDLKVYKPDVSSCPIKMGTVNAPMQPVSGQ